MKKALVLLFVLVVIGVIWFVFSGTPTSDQLGQDQMMQENMLPATGNVDDAVDSILSDVIGEQSYIDEEFLDTDLLGDDTDAINGFGQVVNVNEF